MPTTMPGGQAWVYLDVARALDQTGSAQALRSMLPMLHELLERDVARITQLLANQDVRGASPLLHSLKGCMPIFCGPSLCEHLAQVEFLSKSGTGAQVGEAFAVLRPKLLGLQREVEQYLAQHLDVE